MAINPYLPNLDAINIYAKGSEITDEDRAPVVSACRKGMAVYWGVINAGPFAVKAVVRHCSILEVLFEKRACSYQRTHGPENIRRSILSFEYTHFLTQDFIDAATTTAADAADPSSDPLRLWTDESTLKVFCAKISGIPGPDIIRTFHGHPVKNGMVLQEAHSGQSQEILHRVYERLGRLTQLERLELGQEDRNTFDETRTFDESAEVETLDDEDQQYDCLDMNIRSGLRMLEGLKQLRVLSVVRMATLIGVKEVQWMIQSRPKLKRLDGLNYGESYEVDAYKWLREHCPRIQSFQCDRAGIYE